jgi:hypothetical protein
MALAKTTLSGPVALADKTILMASISGLSVGQTILIDNEKMRVTAVPSAATLPVGVFRGIEGTAVATHPITANVVSGDGSDFSANLDPARRRDKKSYTAAGAIDLPTAGYDLMAILNGTNALAMTLANPTKANDGDVLTIVGNGKAAHTVTYTAGLGAGGANLDVLTFAAGGQQAMVLIAANETWVPLSVYAGTLTNVTVTAS